MSVLAGGNQITWMSGNNFSPTYLGKIVCEMAENYSSGTIIHAIIKIIFFVAPTPHPSFHGQFTLNCMA